jgi:lipopolysaccharide biosynthesis protein
LNRNQKKPQSTICGLVSNWNFSADPVPRWRRRQTLEKLWASRHRRPDWAPIKPMIHKAEWTIYFIYAPDGLLSSAHRFTLSRLKNLGVNLLVVCATPKVSSVPIELNKYADALLWKALDGYDFSAYTLALQQISQQSSNADVIVMNDSVFGPFSNLKECIARSPWDLTGFTASSQVEHHIQSYAYGLKGVNRIRMLKMATVFFPFFAISDAKTVVAIQELRLARIASRSMKVGALWYGDVKDVIDPTLVRPFELIDAGFPFLKRSLLGKHKKFQNTDEVIARLERLGHPI